MRTLWNTLPYSSGYWSGCRMYSSTPSFDSSLVLNDSGSSRTSPSRFPRIFVEYQPASPSMRALKAGASTVFIIVWPVLKSLPPIGAGALLDLADVLPQLLGEVPLGLAALHVGAVQPLHVALIERRGQRLDPLEEVRDRLEMRRIEYAGLPRRAVGVVRNRIPGGEDQVFQLGEGHELHDLGTPLVGALPQPDGPHLRQRPDREPGAPAHVLDARNEGRRYRTQSHEHHAQFSLGGRDVPTGLTHHAYGPFRDCSAGAWPGSVS